MAGSDGDTHLEVFFQQGSCKIVLKRGDLLAEDNVDAKVIPTPEAGQQEPNQSYPLYEKFHASADQSMKRDIKTISSKITQKSAPQIIDTRKPYIILTPTPYFRQGNPSPGLKILQETYLKCLQLASEHKCRSIAFPTIGCGASSFNTDDAAQTLYKALAKHEQSSSKKVNEIRIVVFTTDIYQRFVNVFMDLAHDKNNKLKLLDMSTHDTKPSETGSKRDEKRREQQATSDPKDQEYDDDFEKETTDERRKDSKRLSPKLNPDTPEFRPSNQNRSRPKRTYVLSNNKTHLVIHQGDILKTRVDAIVNAANECMLGGGGVDGVIHDAAGDELLRACRAHKEIYPDVRLPTGRSRILLSYKMSKTTHYIINTAGPRYSDFSPDQNRQHLESCYETSLALANLYDLETIAYTAISCGIFGYPLDEGAEIALRTVDQKAGLMSKITFVLLDDGIYDAWVKKAKHLGFTSLDNFDEDTSSHDQSNNSNESSVRKHDQTTVDRRNGNPGQDRSTPPPGKPEERRIIDASSPNKSEKVSKPNSNKSPERATADADEQSHTDENSNNKENNAKKKPGVTDRTSSNAQGTNKSNGKPSTGGAGAGRGRPRNGNKF
ncbi:unnamed protein product [Adineta ricciae]|uniref:Macro domain-containing protein n=1 Tax=Adineta ricciae TaxID=249248 RepID=A0A813VEJ1_ADIRI|nr:unnamed protein product [Adineta ricciae]CAF1177322.1 unnamed protein product [Adineta ricciae]